MLSEHITVNEIYTRLGEIAVKLQSVVMYLPNILSQIYCNIKEPTYYHPNFISEEMHELSDEITNSGCKARNYRNAILIAVQKHFLSLLGADNKNYITFD